MKKIFVLSFILISITSLQAQEVIDINEAVNIALQNNSTVNNLERNLEIQRLSTSSARGNLFPSLDFNSSWNRNNTFSEGTVTFQNGVPVIIPKQNTWINNFNVGLSSQVTLFNGLANYEQVDLEEQNEVSATIRLNQEKYDVVYSINTAYFDVLKKEKIVGANEVNLADSRAQLESIREFLNVGKRTIADVYRQDVQVAQNELAVERAENDFEKSKIDLLLVMNDDINRRIEVSEQSIDSDLTESEIEAIVARNSNTEALVQNALDKRYDYRAFQQEVTISKTQLSIDKKFLYFPSVGGFANYDLNASRIGDIQNSRSLSFGLSISYPIFQGFNLSNRSQASEIVVKQREEDVRQLQQQIRSDIKKAFIDLETQQKQIDILNRNLVSAEQDKILSEENYRVGFGTLLDVQTAQARLTTLRVDLINSYYDFLLAERTIRFFSGDLTY